MNEGNELMKERIEFYRNKNQVVHISVVQNGFYNGKILQINENHIILLDNKLGEVVIYFREIKRAEPFMEGGR